MPTIEDLNRGMDFIRAQFNGSELLSGMNSRFKTFQGFFNAQLFAYCFGSFVESELRVDSADRKSPGLGRGEESIPRLATILHRSPKDLTGQDWRTLRRLMCDTLIAGYLTPVLFVGEAHGVGAIVEPMAAFKLWSDTTYHIDIPNVSPHFMEAIDLLTSPRIIAALEFLQVDLESPLGIVFLWYGIAGTSLRFVEVYGRPLV